MIEIDSMWRLPSSTFKLPKNDIHVWYASLNQPLASFERLALLLSVDEQARAKRFYFEKDRTRYASGRGILRSILGHYLNVEPQHIQLCYGEYGKPSLEKRYAETALNFNISHSNDLALYAIARGKSVGIDLEHIREIADMDQVVKKFFAEKEQATFYNLHPNERREAFFKVWTRKEAYLKAIGVGLSEPLHYVEVSVSPQDQPGLLSVVGTSQDASHWSLQDMASPPGYVATLAVEGKEYQLIYR